MSNKVNLEAYQDFVEAVTSNEANQLTPFIDRLDDLSETTDVNIPLFLNSAIGMAAEGGATNMPGAFWAPEALPLLRSSDPDVGAAFPSGRL